MTCERKQQPVSQYDFKTERVEAVHKRIQQDLSSKELTAFSPMM